MDAAVEPRTPLAVPVERPVVRVPDLRARVEGAVTGSVDAVLACFPGEALPTSAAEFQRLEEALVATAHREVVGPVLSVVLHAINENTEFARWSVRAAQARSRDLVSLGGKPVTIRVAGGTRVSLTTPALESRPRGKPGPKRANGRRGKGGGGLYAVLACLGFVSRCSPYVASRVARVAATVDSYAEAREALRAESIDLNVKTVCSLVSRVGDACLIDREGEGRTGKTAETLAGKRVMVGIDGGRLRYRLDKPGRRLSSGRHGFEAPWREPKILTVYTFDANGKKERRQRPIYEGTLAPWEDAADLIARTLRRYGAERAKLVVFAADGSENIWRHVDGICKAAGLDPAKVTSLVDFYHAVEHLSDAAKLVPGWSDEQRQRWVTRNASLLKRGGVETVAAAIEQFTVADRDALTKEVEYFRLRAGRMRYDVFKRQGIPLGTGAVESTIRRVVNLRLKSTGTFWTPECAERMLVLRCRLKAGRWDEVEAAVHNSALLPARIQQPQILARLLA